MLQDTPYLLIVRQAPYRPTATLGCGGLDGSHSSSGTIEEGRQASGVGFSPSRGRPPAQQLTGGRGQGHPRSLWPVAARFLVFSPLLQGTGGD